MSKQEQNYAVDRFQEWLANRSQLASKALELSTVACNRRLSFEEVGELMMACFCGGRDVQAGVDVLNESELMLARLDGRIQ